MKNKDKRICGRDFQVAAGFENVARYGTPLAEIIKHFRTIRYNGTVMTVFAGEATDIAATWFEIPADIARNCIKQATADEVVDFLSV